MIRRLVSRAHLRKLAAATLAVATACTAQRSELPPVASPPTDQHRPGEFVWFDLLVDDPDAARAFYGPLFGWTFEPLDDGSFDTIVNQGRPIGGLIRHTPHDDRTPDDVWLPSLSVADVDRSVANARAAGADILRKPRDLGERGRVAVLRDPGGAPFAVMRSAAGDPKAVAPSLGDFLWVQLWVRDHEVALPFYDRVAGWKVGEVVSHDGVEEGVFERDGVHVAGVIELPWKHVRANWLPYVRVADVAATIAAAKKSGGRVLVRGDHLAILQDPQGAAIGVGLASADVEKDR